MREGIRGCCAGAAAPIFSRAIMHTTRVTTFARAYHNNRPDPDAGADGCVEGGESRPCAGGVVLWERALLAWGIKISVGEPAGTRTRAQDEKGAPDASTDAGVLPARCSSPPAVAAGRDGRPELTKSPPNSGAVRAQSADTSRRRLRPAGSSHEPALADGRAAAHVEDSAQAPASPLPASC